MPLLAATGVRHLIGGLRLGDTITPEGDGQPHAAADLHSDDYGVFGAVSLITDTSTVVNVDIGQVGKLNVWVDFNRDGVFGGSRPNR